MGIPRCGLCSACLFYGCDPECPCHWDEGEEKPDRRQIRTREILRFIRKKLEDKK